ncbi:hypothetical protein GCM10023328_45080 [Modestobacter marinus]|uniref:Uncharacterized protein n=1 Tax=Modestobacter marinus TaxID=477641 RepID=A0A846LUY5_9ACTN|nr:hypothetical protein [Modestobacter marinus]NIH69288.1 hypothetical protein [Modestobacter marinus]
MSTLSHRDELIGLLGAAEGLLAGTGDAVDLCPTCGVTIRGRGSRGTREQATPLMPAETERLTKRGLRLAQFTVVYNVVEGAIAITVGSSPGGVSHRLRPGLGIESTASVLVSLLLAAWLRGG